jgi:hypothetical protein
MALPIAAPRVTPDVARTSVIRSELILLGVAMRLAGLVRGLFDRYRPELFYMRGPGPKWHAKHGRRPTSERS